MKAEITKVIVKTQKLVLKIRSMSESQRPASVNPMLQGREQVNEETLEAMDTKVQWEGHPSQVMWVLLQTSHSSGPGLSASVSSILLTTLKKTKKSI